MENYNDDEKDWPKYLVAVVVTALVTTFFTLSNSKFEGHGSEYWYDQYDDAVAEAEELELKLEEYKVALDEANYNIDEVNVQIEELQSTDLSDYEYVEQQIYDLQTADTVYEP